MKEKNINVADSVYGFLQKGFDYGVSRKLMDPLDPQPLLLRQCIANALMLVLRPQQQAPLPVTLDFDSFDIQRIGHALKFASLVASILHMLSLELCMHTTYNNKPENSAAEFLATENKALLDSVVQRFLASSLLLRSKDNYKNSFVKIDEKVPSFLLLLLWLFVIAFDLILQFIKSMVKFLNERATPTQSLKMLTIEKNLLEIYSNPEHTRRMMFYNRFMDCIYTNLTDDCENARPPASPSNRYTSTIATYLFPLLQRLSAELKAIVHLNLKIHSNFYMETLIKILSASAQSHTLKPNPPASAAKTKKLESMSARML